MCACVCDCVTVRRGSSMQRVRGPQHLPCSARNGWCAGTTGSKLRHNTGQNHLAYIGGIHLSYKKCTQDTCSHTQPWLRGHLPTLSPGSLRFLFRAWQDPHHSSSAPSHPLCSLQQQVALHARCPHASCEKEANPLGVGPTQPQKSKWSFCQSGIVKLLHLIHMNMYGPCTA